ncbi:MAG: Stp1/IreP family PP2C-type Ser/Thr phosphatase [Clostridia bacterium]|jgi:protein serine/threonine phosphatase
MKTFAKTDIGKARDMNQDYYYVSRPEDEIQLYIIADGMGGYNGGEIASSLAVNSIKSYIQSNYQETPKDKVSLPELIRSSIEYANMVIYEKSKENDDLEGMGTTIDVCLIYNNRVYIGHVGDSRVYRIRKEFIRRLTTDDSYVQDLIKKGTISKEEAFSHPKKNMLTKALGCTPYVEPTILLKGFQKGDILLLTSDGLTNMVKEDKLYEIIKQDIANAVNNLIEEANKQGGYDNITAVVIENN